ncbi:MAG: hypothetical protein KIT36_05210 [Alphaproteobacteria bacterium]|nr:hypothetical protein [Alphaproteobacteria bacterium]
MRSLIAAERGGVVVLVALAVPTIAGSLALASDLGYWYATKRQTQQQADSAAYGAARLMREGAVSNVTLRSVALKDAVRNGYPDLAANSLTVNRPPTSGTQAGNVNAVEVMIVRQAESFFARIFGIMSVTIHARAVVSAASGEACVLALSTSKSRALNITGSTTIDAPTCALATNSSAADSIVVGGSSSLIAKSLSTVGGISLTGNTTLNEPAVTKAAPITDPYAGLVVPPVGACSATNFKLGGPSDSTINPGVYCGGISMSGSGTLYLNKGTYILNRGDFSMTGSGRIRCGNCTSPTDGVTIILTATSGKVGSVSIAGSGDVELAAPGTGPYEGVVFFQDPAASAGNDAKFNGGSNMKLSGAIYLPSADISYTGSNTFAPGKDCVEIIGLTVEMNGNSGLHLSDCKAMGTKGIELLRGLTLRE